jgi:hypothetical protein
MIIVEKFFTVGGEKRSIWCPSWAEWMAFDDRDPTVWVFDKKPERLICFWANTEGWRYCKIDIDPYCDNWRKSLRRLR